MNMLDMEQLIMKAWSTSEDLELIRWYLMDAKESSKDVDDIDNLILGVWRLHELRMLRLFEEYEQVIKLDSQGKKMKQPLDSFTVSV